MDKILVTGGLGYIGSHTVVALMDQGYEPVIIDNLSNSRLSVLDRIEEIKGKRPTFYKVEMCDQQALREVFEKEQDIKAVIHFAAFLLVDESVEQPLQYYQNNLISTLNLLTVLRDHKAGIVFSSSCTVYGNPDQLPVDENAPIKPAQSPYGNTKKIGEDILRDAAHAYQQPVISLRYFNPIGAHESALIGEFQQGAPHHLVPYITETAKGIRKELKIFGKDWNTKDGTCVRDYIHVMDIAEAHIAAVKRLSGKDKREIFEVFNLGTGTGYSVLEMVQSFQKVTQVKVPYSFAERRAGDVEAVYADTAKAKQVLGWEAKRSLDEMLLSAWKWENAIK